jgi:hypothetical protein
MRHPIDPIPTSRRGFLSALGGGFGAVALAALAAEEAAAALPHSTLENRKSEDPLAPRAPHYPARAKRVILLWMQGGPSQMDLFDYKPRLAKENGEPIPFSVPDTIEKVQAQSRLLTPVTQFRQVGQSGMWMSDLLPHLATKVDELCFLRGMQSDSSAHPGAIRLFHTGSLQFVRPSMGSWITYGLGTENRNLPGFVVISPMLFGDDGSPLHYNNVFLPAAYQGTRIGIASTPIKDSRINHLGDPTLSPELQREQLDLIQRRNRRDQLLHGEDRNMEGLIQSYELAFRMQAQAPEVLDVSREPAATHALYGIGQEPTDNFGRKCLMARRLIEAGVRFVQVTDTGWDHHASIRTTLRKSCAGIDRPMAGLLTDLKARGLLDDTLVIWTGEFGRTPYDQDTSNGKAGLEARGRDHNPHCWTMWMAGAGIRPGTVYGETDEYAWKAVDGRVHVHDLHATILHLLGLDHTKLTYRYSGRDFRLTDVFGRVVREVLV